MSPGIGWVGGGLAGLGEPIRIRHGLRIVVASGSPDSGHWPPEIVSVFGVVKSNHPIRERQIQQREEPSALRSAQLTVQGRGLGDLVPIVLNRPIPKSAGQCLVRRGGRAIGGSQRFDLIEGLAICIAGQRWRRTGTKLIRALQGEGRDMRPMSELRLWRKIRRCGLVITGRASEEIQNRLSIGSVIAPQSQDMIRYGLPYEEALGLGLPTRNLC